MIYVVNWSFLIIRYIPNKNITKELNTGSLTSLNVFISTNIPISIEITIKKTPNTFIFFIY
jgi:hypothetical protein